MKFILNGFFKCLIFILVLTVLASQPATYKVNASLMNNSNKARVIEELRLNVPLEYKNAWLKAEAEIWEPWLEQKKGYMGREILYNEINEEALVLVEWETKELWKNIPPDEVNQIQIQFENYVSRSLKLTKNPFALIYEGELKRENG